MLRYYRLIYNRLETIITRLVRCRLKPSKRLRKQEIRLERITLLLLEIDLLERGQNSKIIWS